MKNFLLAVFICGALGVSGLSVYATHEFKNSAPLKEEKILNIPKGSGVRGMARILEREGIISNQYIFTAFAFLTGTHPKLQAGEYQFPPGSSMAGVLAKIASGDVYERNFTIPEGKTSFEIVEILNKIPDLKGEIKEIPPEGSLLPSTYNYKTTDTRADIIARLGKKLRSDVIGQCGYLEDALDWNSIHSMSFQDFLNLPCPENNAQWNRPNFESKIRNIVTLASIVEKETGVPSERKRIAGVFLNRLKINMPLQTDPTVIYGITNGAHKNEGQGPLGRRLLIKDLQTPSPYNTYTNTGLPPGPIANPGSASIEAVLQPEENNFLYFVADGKGGHVFAATLEEHNRNVAQWRQIRAQQERDKSAGGN